MLKKIKEIIKSKSDYKKAKNMYIKEKKERVVCDLCINCKFLETSLFSDGSVSFKCSIDPSENIGSIECCKYRK